LDWGSTFNITLDAAFYANLLGIIVINLVLSGDNAVLIAMAVRNLPRVQRQKGILFGTGMAVILRIILTFFVSMMMEIDFIKLAGGLLILWIGMSLFMESEPCKEGKECATMSQAIKIILIADLTMSLDNVLAIAGAAQGSPLLLIIGLVVSIPIVVYASSLLSMLMDKYPIIIVIGAAILGKVGGEMIITDRWVEGMFHPGRVMEYTAMTLGIVTVVAGGKLWAKWNASRRPEIPEGANLVAEKVDVTDESRRER
jgi:YjbE family integral membrane protein